MPGLHLHFNRHHPANRSRRLAARLYWACAEKMKVDIRRGGSAEYQRQVAGMACDDCILVLGLREQRLNMEGVQHGADERYRTLPGDFRPKSTSHKI